MQVHWTTVFALPNTSMQKRMEGWLDWGAVYAAPSAVWWVLRQIEERLDGSNWSMHVRNVDDASATNSYVFQIQRWAS